jgi:hypothetical protein
VSALARRYGASPLHVLGHLALFALTAWALGHVLDFRGATDWFVWFLGAALVHDFLFLPAYVVLDRLAGARRPARWTGHLRVPAVVSGVLLLVWFPLIAGLGVGTFERVAGVDAGTERLRDWLLITAGLFAASLAIYVVRSRRGVVDDLGGRRPQDGDAPRRRVG